MSSFTEMFGDLTVGQALELNEQINKIKEVKNGTDEKR